MTFSELITQSLQDSQVMKVPGQTPPTEYTAQGLAGLNMIFDQWNADGPFAWAMLPHRFVCTTLPSGTPYYTIGPSGADFTAARPSGQGPGKGIRIANFIMTDQSPEARVGLYIMDTGQWSSVTVQEQDTDVPWAIYNDGGFPNSKLYLYGQPTAGNELEIYTNEQVAQVSNLAAAFSMAPGYQLAVRYTLAEDLCVTFGKEVPRSLAKAANHARAIVKINNLKTGLLSSDAARLNPYNRGRGSGYNYITGMTGF